MAKLPKGNFPMNIKKIINVCLFVCILLSVGCAKEEVMPAVDLEAQVAELQAQIKELETVEEPAPTLEPVVVIGPDDIPGGPRLIRKAPHDDNKYNGYQYELNSKWIPGIPTYKSWFTPSPKVFSGAAFPYGWSVMEATAAYNGFSLDGYVDGVALMSCADQGLPVWLKRPGHSWEGPYLVVDCAKRTDYYNVSVHNAESVEVGFETAVRWGMSTERYIWNDEWVSYWLEPRIDDVIVSKTPPNQLPADYESVEYKEWFLDMVEFDHFATDEEATAYYLSVPRFLRRNPTEAGGMPYWRIPPSNKFIQFPPAEIYSTLAETNLIIPKAMTVHTPTSVSKSFEVEAGEFWMEIDLSQQVLYAYRGDQQINEFVISSGKVLTPTPLGSYEVYSMYEEYTMLGQDGNIPGVKWSMFFHHGYAIHATDWHNSFGKPMSRGCINMRTDDAKWLYDRVDEGTRVYVHI